MCITISYILQERKKREEREAREKEEQAKRDQELAQQQELENRRRKKEELRNQIPPVRSHTVIHVIYGLEKPSQTFVTCIFDQMQRVHFTNVQVSARVFRLPETIICKSGRKLFCSVAQISLVHTFSQNVF